MRYFDDFEVGESWPIDTIYEMSEEEIVSFAAKWDPQPFHVDKAAAAKSIYGTLTACGSHIQSVVLKLAQGLPHETAVLGALGYDEVRFHKAAKLGYHNNRDFEGSASAGRARDLGPEGLTFVPAAASPNGRDLLIVANEVSGTTSIFEITLSQ